jgi:phosphate transport system permease protein
MSEGYARDTALIREPANYYDRALDVTIALSIVSFLLGLLTLVKALGLTTSGAELADLFGLLLAVGVGGVGFVAVFAYLGVVSVGSRRIRGIATGLVVVLIGLTAVTTVVDLALARLLGLLLVVQAGAVLAAGVSSRMDLVDTDPSNSAGVLAGVTFGLLGLLTGAAIGGSVLGGSAVAFGGSGIAFGIVLGLLALLPREDVASTVPVALVVGLLGLTITTAVVGPGWQWNPGHGIRATFTGGVVIPIFTVVGSVVSGWAAGKSRAGFGALGRQFGAFLVIDLTAVLMVVVMLSIVAFVTMKGATYAIHGFTIGAPSALVALAPFLLLAVSVARTPAGSDDWHRGARQVFRVVPLAAVGSLATVLASVVGTGEAIELPFTYQVMTSTRQMKTLDTAITVTPEATVGNLLVLIAAVVLFGALFRRYGSLRGVGSKPDWLDAVHPVVGVSIGVQLLASVVLALLGATPFGIPIAGTVGVAFVWGGLVGSLVLAAFPLAGMALADGSVPERVQDGAPWVAVGLFGSLGLLAGSIVLQSTAGVIPTVGSANLAPGIALAGLAAALAVATLAAYGRRSTTERITERPLGEEITLGLAAAAGFVALVALHVALTGIDFTVGGVTVGRLGTLSWPMTMEAYIPLGPEPGGILPAVVGTIWLVIGASLFAIPLGVGAAVFLTEYAEQGRFTALVETATNALWSTPSVVFGLFGAAFLIPRLGGDESLVSGMLVLGFMLLPLVLITSREAILAVPDEYRDASAALGVNRWQTIRSVVLPASLPGVITGVILGVGRIAGETAPLILVLGSTLNSTAAVDVLGSFQFVGHPPFVENPALFEASAALPTQVWAVIAAGVSGSPSMGWGSALVLLMVVLVFYTVGILTRIYFRRKLNYE